MNTHRKCLPRAGKSCLTLAEPNLLFLVCYGVFDANGKNNINVLILIYKKRFTLCKPSQISLGIFHTKNIWQLLAYTIGALLRYNTSTQKYEVRNKKCGILSFPDVLNFKKILNIID